jgi:hypothetical protein
MISYDEHQPAPTPISREQLTQLTLLTGWYATDGQAMQERRLWSADPISSLTIVDSLLHVQGRSLDLKLPLDDVRINHDSTILTVYQQVVLTTPRKTAEGGGHRDITQRVAILKLKNQPLAAKLNQERIARQAAIRQQQEMSAEAKRLEHNQAVTASVSRDFTGKVLDRIEFVPDRGVCLIFTDGSQLPLSISHPIGGMRKALVLGELDPDADYVLDEPHGNAIIIK